MLVKRAKYRVFGVYRRTYLIWSPVIGLTVVVVVVVVVVVEVVVGQRTICIYQKQHWHSSSGRQRSTVRTYTRSEAARRVERCIRMCMKGRRRGNWDRMMVFGTYLVIFILIIYFCQLSEFRVERE